MAATVDTFCREYGYGSDDTWQPEIAAMCLAAAKGYMAAQGVKERAHDPLYDLCVYMLTLHWYDNRGVMTIGKVSTAFPLGVNEIIWTLKYTPEEAKRNVRRRRNAKSCAAGGDQ